MYKSSGVIHLEQIKNWNKLKLVSNFVNAILTCLSNSGNLDHFAFGLETKNQNDLLNVTFSLLNKKCKLVEFNSMGTKTKRNY